MRPLIEPGDWVVLDRDPVQRTHPDFAFVYALEIGGRGFLARCRLVGNCLVTVTDAPRLESGPPRYVELEGYAGAYVRGLVVWVSRRM